MKVVKLLLKNGADVNVKNKKGKTPLYPTCSEGHSKITRLLLKKGADANTVDKYGRTCDMER
jgi:ankyrin repeat protein